MAEIPLFPLPLVVFPGGRLPLQVFETRYLDMVKACMRDNAGFGVIMIAEGDQVVRTAEDSLPSIYSYGTYVEITDFDALPNGMLKIMVEGRVKFRVRSGREQEDRLMLGDVEFMALEETATVPPERMHLVDMLSSFLAHDMVKALGYDMNLEDAGEVGARLTELLPCNNELKQALFELTDPLDRLEQLDELIQRMQDSTRPG